MKKPEQLKRLIKRMWARVSKEALQRGQLVTINLSLLFRLSTVRQHLLRQVNHVKNLSTRADTGDLLYGNSNPPPPPPSTRLHYVSTSTIQPSNLIDSTQRIELTPWDLTFLPVQSIQRGLLFLKPKPKPKEEEEEEEEEEDDFSSSSTLISHLKTSFAEAINHFYPLAGRLGTTLHKEDNTTSVYINCNSAGAEFIHATANEVTIADILNPTYIPCGILHSFFPQNGVINYNGQSKPLISVQVTELIDGIFIGLSVNHCVCDGTSFWHFINSWSEIARREKISCTPVFKRRSLINVSDFPIHLPFHNDERFKEIVTAPLLAERSFHFSSQNIARLKSKANLECGSDLNKQISSLQALLAHIWLAVTRARNLDSNEEVHYRVIVENRRRLNPPLPQEYFGNSVSGTTASVKAGELLEKGLGFGASLLNHGVNSYTEESIRSSWKSWIEKPVLWFGNGFVFNNSLFTGSSPRFNMYGNDFGWGRPIAVRSGCANKFFDGKMTIYPSAVEGSMEIEASLAWETLKAMGDDAQFMEAVTTLPLFKS